MNPYPCRLVRSSTACRFPIILTSSLNAGISVPIGRHLQLFARALNLTDRQSEEALGYSALGRSGIVGVRVVTSR